MSKASTRNSRLGVENRTRAAQIPCVPDSCAVNNLSDAQGGPAFWNGTLGIPTTRDMASEGWHEAQQLTTARCHREPAAHVCK